MTVHSSKVTVNLVQWPRNPNREKPDPYAYEVVKLTNAREPAIGTMLTMKQVDELIGAGITVNVTMGK